jgi:hypothetical protein
MTEQKNDPDPLEELKDAVLLPPREAMSLIDTNPASLAKTLSGGLPADGAPTAGHPVAPGTVDHLPADGTGPAPAADGTSTDSASSTT